MGTSTSSAVNRAGTGGVVLGNAAVTMTAPANTASRATRRYRLYRIALYAANITAANVIVVSWSWATSTAAKITPNAAAGYRRRNASGAVVSMMPSRSQPDGAGGWIRIPPCGPAMAWTDPLWRVGAIAAATEATVAATAMARSMTQAGRDVFTAPLSPGLGRAAIARAAENRTSPG